MIKIFYLLILNLIVFSAFAQVQKAYVTKDGDFSDDPKKGVAYVIVEKLPGDSAYIMRNYDMNDTILMQGTYKDQFLKIPNGRFIYYYKDHVSTKTISEMKSVIRDTNNYVKKVEYYTNGVRTGVWVEYIARNQKSSEYTYANNQKNGKYKLYYDNLQSWTEGNMVNDLMEGTAYTYRADSLLISEHQYVNNKLVNTINHWTEAHYPDGFQEYLQKQLKKYQREIAIAEPPTVQFTVSKTGEILNPKIVSGVNPDVDKALVAALTSSKPFSPATHDGVPIEQNFGIVLVLFKEAKLFRIDDNVHAPRRTVVRVVNN